MSETARETDLPEHSIPVLSYAPPAARTSKRDAWFGVIISFCLAIGVGWVVFGALMMAGFRDDHAGPVAVGLAFIVLGLAMAGTLLWLHRHPR